IGYVLRPESEGTVHITSLDPQAPPAIETGYFTAPHDRETGVRIFKQMRSIFAKEPIASHISSEIEPGPGVETDDYIIETNMATGYCGYHAIGACAMGTDDDDVVDPELRVRGVENLRVMDCSVLPVMVAGNLNAPMMAMASRAAEMILSAR